MRTGPGQGGYMPPAMEVTGVNKGESQWEVLARIQAHYVGETMRYVGKAARHVEVSEYAAASL